MGDLENLRLKVRALLNLTAPADALAAYCGLYHDPARTRLHVHEDEQGRVDGFIAVCQTGQRLFQPTVMLRTPDARVAVELIRQALVPGRPYVLVTTPDLREVVVEVMDAEHTQVGRIYGLDLLRFQPQVNVLVVAEQGLGGRPRFVIRSQGQIVSQAGVNWDSPHFAEVFVYTIPAAQGRGWGRAVLTTCTTWVLRSARQPLYIIREENADGTIPGPSIALAEATGYVDTGAREFTAEGVYGG